MAGTLCPTRLKAKEYLMNTRTPDERLGLIEGRLDEVAGQVAAVIAYLAHVHGAESVHARELKATLDSMSPPRIAPSTPQSPLDVANRTAHEIAQIAHNLAEIRRADPKA
jgi:hypothetical protein